MSAASNQDHSVHNGDAYGPRSRASRRATACLTLSASIAIAGCEMPKEDPFVRCMNLSVGAFQAATPDTVRECRAYAQERNRTDNLRVNDKAAQ